MTKEIPVPFYDSAKQSNPAWDEFIQTLRYKDLIMHLVRRDVTARYKRSVLGVAWTHAQPAWHDVDPDSRVFPGIFHN